MKSKVDHFFKNSKTWHDEALALRAVLSRTALEENLKWNLPCYTYQGKNVAILQPFKKSLALMFFKGALLKDAKKILVPNGPNSRSGQRLEFFSLAEVKKHAKLVEAYVKEAIKIEASGQKVITKRDPVAMPEELRRLFRQKPAVKKAFAELTPGRQRAYLLYFNGAKQTATRSSRIQKSLPAILRRLGPNDR